MKPKKKIAYNGRYGIVGGAVQTIRANYWDTSIANFMRPDGFYATCVIEIYETNLQDRP